jgi:TolA-binding protein/predicted negative regulator of RcsB-dependent stress response
MGVIMICIALTAAPQAWAAPRPESAGTEVQVDLAGKTLILAFGNSRLKVAVLPANSHENPRIEISGWDPDGRFDLASSDGLPVLFIDLFMVLPGFKTAVLPVDTGWVKTVRMGHHRDRVRVVLDGMNTDIPKTVVARKRDGLVVTLDPPGDGLDEPSGLSVGAGAGSGSAADWTPPAPVMAPVDPPAFAGKDRPERKTRSGSAADIVRHALLEISHIEDTPDGRVFKEAVSHFNSREWAMARNKIGQVITDYPKSPYAENAYYLLTEILRELYAADPETHYRQLSDSFRNALTRFPKSPFAGGALLRLAQLHLSMGNFAEARAYYNLVRDRVPADTAIARWAVLDTAKILRHSNSEKQALSLLENLLKTADNAMIKQEALLESAGILHDEQHFEQSRKKLDTLVAEDRDTYFRFPDISLYMGNNAFQLGQYSLARTHLLHHYNTAPEQQNPDMILARIGDACLQQGHTINAIRFFLFVVNHHPGTRGADISWLRLAEQKEKDPDNDTQIPYSARQIYENIRDGYQDGNRDRSIKDPLALLSILKLAVLYHREKNYSRSLETLHLLFDNRPEGTLRENGRFALKNVLEAMISEAFEAEDFKQVVFLYLSEQERVQPLLDSDDILLKMARAYLHLGNTSAALDFYQKAAFFISKEKSPDDLLFFTGKALFEASQMQAAEERLALLLENHPQSPYAVSSLDIMAQILIDRKKFGEAIEVMSRALTYPVPPCGRAKVRVRMAGAMHALGDTAAALASLATAREVGKECTDLSGYLEDQIGDLYFEMGHFNEAVSVYTRVLEMSDARVEKAALQYKIALSLWCSGRKQAGQEMFEALAGLNTPFWSPLAREYLASAAFEEKIR